MSDPPDSLVAAREWFRTGDSDLRSARVLLDLSPPESSTAAFHCQQAAEKYIKGFLAFHGEDPPRIHDLTVLLELAEEYDASLGDYEDDARILVPFAVAGRYPCTGTSPRSSETEQALEATETLREALVARIPGVGEKD